MQKRLTEIQLGKLIISNCDPEEKFEMMVCLGKGNYGKVFKARTRKEGKTVAIKMLPISHELDCLKKEIGILMQC